MSIVIGVTTTIESQSLTLDLNALVTRVAKLLRRDDLNDEITQWVNFAQRELTDKVGFPELRRTVQTTMLNGVWFYDLPIDFTREEKMYWLDDTVTPSVGRNLDPLPRSYYEEAGIEPRLNVSVPTPGEPLYYLIRKFRILTYPAINKADTKLQMSYYRRPTDILFGTDLPSIEERFRHYLIPLTYYWGQMFLEKEDINKILYWQRKFDKVVAEVKYLTDRKENRNRTPFPPRTGTEFSDRVY